MHSAPLGRVPFLPAGKLILTVDKGEEHGLDPPANRGSENPTKMLAGMLIEGLCAIQDGLRSPPNGVDSMGVTIRVVIAEDHPLSREGLRQYLAMAGDIDVVGEASNGLELLEFLEYAEVVPDVALVDARMPTMDGVSAAQAIAERFPEVAVIILTAFDDPELVHEALGAGVRGYLLKDRDAEELVRAVRRVFTGETVIDSERQRAEAAE